MEADKIQSQLKFLGQCTASNTALLNLPTKLIHDQFSRTTISQQVFSGVDPFSTNMGGQGKIFNTPTRCSAATRQTGMTQPHNLKEETRSIRVSIALYPMQPATEKGWAMYHKQMNTWLQNNGDVLLTKKTGFPLCPGGAQLGSGECFRCGLVGHH